MLIRLLQFHPDTRETKTRTPLLNWLPKGWKCLCQRPLAHVLPPNACFLISFVSKALLWIFSDPWRANGKGRQARLLKVGKSTAHRTQPFSDTKVHHSLNTLFTFVQSPALNTLFTFVQSPAPGQCSAPNFWKFSSTLPLFPTARARFSSCAGGGGQAKEMNLPKRWKCPNEQEARKRIAPKEQKHKVTKETLSPQKGCLPWWLYFSLKTKQLLPQFCASITKTSLKML